MKELENDGRIVDARRLQRVVPSPAQAERLLASADAHMNAVQAIKDVDPEGAFILLYDSAP